jgi:hypothetical protein
MRLAACVEPQEVLRPAPISALCQPQTDAEWAGFWALDGERYFARLRYPGGDVRRFEQWFVLVDTVPAVGDGRPESPSLQSRAIPTPAALDGVPPVTAVPVVPRRSAVATRVILRRSTVRPSIDGPAVRRTAAVMVRHRRGDTTR